MPAQHEPNSHSAMNENTSGPCQICGADEYCGHDAPASSPKQTTLKPSSHPTMNAIKISTILYAVASVSISSAACQWDGFGTGLFVFGFFSLVASVILFFISLNGRV